MPTFAIGKITYCYYLYRGDAVEVYAVSCGML